MKSAIIVLTLTILTAWLIDAVGQQAEVRSATRTEPAAVVAAPTQPPPPTTPGDINAPPGVLKSAACCLKQCAGGGTCGQNCEVVDNLSACASNFKFECPANKGLTCLGEDCSCE